MVFFAKKTQELTLKTRVERFWRWYESVAPRFFKTIQAGKIRELVPETSKKLNELFPELAWVFGPGEGGEGYSFTLSGGGVLSHQLVAQYCVSQAPQVPGWTFYSSRQPGNVSSMELKIGTQVFVPKEFWITPKVDVENEKVDISVWHPLWTSMEESERFRILFLFLDELLGEYGTEHYLGEIKFCDKQLRDSMPLTELLMFINKTVTDLGWKKLPPGEACVGLKTEEPDFSFPRGDIIVATTMHPHLFMDFADAKGRLPDLLPNTGADFVYVSFPSSTLPKDHETEFRFEMEDSLNHALQDEKSGRLLGGAYGLNNAYIDLMIYDGQKSLEIIKRSLLEMNIKGSVQIHYFAKEKKGSRVVVS